MDFLYKLSKLSRNSQLSSRFDTICCLCYKKEIAEVIGEYKLWKEACKSPGMELIHDEVTKFIDEIRDAFENHRKEIDYEIEDMYKLLAAEGDTKE